jgi:hypothetical protein
MSGGASAPTSLPSGANSGNNLPMSMPSGSNEKVVMSQRRLSLVDTDLSDAVTLMHNLVCVLVQGAVVYRDAALTTGGGIAAEPRLAIGKC